MAGLQKYSSQEYLHSGAEMDSLKVRNNPIMLPGPQEAREGESQAYLSRDGSLYQSNEHLTISEAKRRSRHRSGSQSRDSSYTWAGRAQLAGTGLRVGSAVTEPEPRDGVALSRDGGFFMPFGNTENLAGKCKTRRQLKAEEQLRRRQEEEEEKERRQVKMFLSIKKYFFTLKNILGA